MKIKSKALFLYLQENGVLNGTPEEIDQAKREYRKKYKRRNKQDKRVFNTPVSLSFTRRELIDIKLLAEQNGLKYPEYMKDVLLSNLSKGNYIYNKELILRIQQNIGIAISVTERGTIAHQYLLKAEQLLIEYLE